MKNSIGVVIGVLAMVVWGTSAMSPTQEARDAVAEDGLPYQRTVLIQLAVSDIERSMKFYGEVLELKLDIYQPELEWAKYEVGIPGVRIGIGRQDRVAGSGTASINIGVGNLDEARARLEAKGVEFPKPSVSIPGVVKLADFTDPDGNRFRLAGPPDDAPSAGAHSRE